MPPNGWRGTPGLTRLPVTVWVRSSAGSVPAHAPSHSTGTWTRWIPVILSHWKKNPFSGEVTDGLVYGRGSVDQKGGVAAMLTAGRILKELTYDGQFTIYFTLTVLEEAADGLAWSYLIEEEELRPEFVVITAPTNLNLCCGASRSHGDGRRTPRPLRPRFGSGTGRQRDLQGV